MEPNARRQGVIKRDQVRLAGAAPRPRAGAAEPEPEVALADEACAPRVRLLRLDEHTQAIEVTCPCGDVSLIEIRTEKKS